MFPEALGDIHAAYVMENKRISRAAQFSTQYGVLRLHVIVAQYIYVLFKY